LRRLAEIAMTGVLVVPAWQGVACPGAKGQDAHVGWIEKIGDKCEGRWRAPDGSEPKKLHSANDRYRFLYPGESVRCEGSGSMTLQILDNQPKSILRRDGWCTIHNEVAVCEKETMHESSDTAALKHFIDQRALGAFGRPAGRSRGFPSAIFCPAAESTVRAGELVLRWNEIPGAARISLRLADKYHSVLWEQADIEAAARQLVSPASRAALAGYREKGGAGPFTLILTKNGTAQPATTFSILSADEEHDLDQKLANCDRSKGLLRSVCRTFEFSRREMWNDAAEEYEAALKLAPYSRDLLLAALAGETSIGNARRVAELLTKLPAGVAIPP
jgi:hypothetical protein